MYAMLVKVRIEPARHAEAMTDLHESIVPRVKSAPGFERGIWFRDQANGHGLAVFESEDQLARWRPWSVHHRRTIRLRLSDAGHETPRSR